MGDLMHIAYMENSRIPGKYFYATSLTQIEQSQFNPRCVCGRVWHTKCLLQLCFFWLYQKQKNNRGILCEGNSELLAISGLFTDYPIMIIMLSVLIPMIQLKVGSRIISFTCQHESLKYPTVQEGIKYSEITLGTRCLSLSDEANLGLLLLQSPRDTHNQTPIWAKQLVKDPIMMKHDDCSETKAP